MSRYDEMTLAQLAAYPWAYDDVLFAIVDADGRLVAHMIRPPARYDADLVGLGIVACAKRAERLGYSGGDIDRMLEIAPAPWRQGKFGDAEDARQAPVFNILSTRGDANPEWAIKEKIIVMVNDTAEARLLALGCIP